MRVDEPELIRVERLLRSVGAPPEVPEALHAAARAAALGDAPSAPAAAPVVDLASRRRWRRPARLGAAVVVLAGAAAASVVIGVGGAARGPAIQSTVALSGAGGGHATMQVSVLEHGVRQVVFTADGLRPAPPGHYYEVWFQSGKTAMTLATFGSPVDGHVQLRTTMPGSLYWSRCWVTMESVSGGSSRVVLDSGASV